MRYVGGVLHSCGLFYFTVFCCVTSLAIYSIHYFTIKYLIILFYKNITVYIFIFIFLTSRLIFFSRSCCISVRKVAFLFSMCSIEIQYVRTKSGNVVNHFCVRSRLGRRHSFYAGASVALRAWHAVLRAVQKRRQFSCNLLLLF